MKKEIKFLTTDNPVHSIVRLEEVRGIGLLKENAIQISYKDGSFCNWIFDSRSDAIIAFGKIKKIISFKIEI